MRHGRDDYQQIQDPHGVIGEDEPVFVLRAKDLTAPAIVEAWADLAEKNGAPVRAAGARAQADAMRVWQETPGNYTRYPADA
ncbi:hypothetical protein ACIBQX_11195 [Nonomuraea sp. NPDC049714]|uniref:hypothetical protein n=1 Tax=Nonomuraea sp. NPDC049714 TaxID=3364357 RepID=UPI0037B8D0B1